MSCIAGYKQGVYESGAYNADFVLCITEDDPTEYRIEEYNWIFGAEYADSLGTDIINSSLGYNTFDDTTMNYTYAQMDGKTAVITKGAELAANKGMLVVVSVGNEGSNSWKKLVAPADGDSVLSVGAVNPASQHAYFSSDGPSADGRIKPEVAAPGSPAVIVSALNNVTSGDGTSYSAPLVTGLAAGVWQAYPDLNNMELREVIEKGSSQYSTPDTLLGYGIPDFKKIQSVITALSDDFPAEMYKVYPNPVQYKRLFIEYGPEYSGSALDVEIFNAAGKSCLATTVKMNRKNFKAELNLESLEPGIYILCLNSRAGKGKVRLLVP
jgi:subtilisin family serine protease